jgi:uncharacterized protein (DUF952 family)
MSNQTIILHITTLQDWDKALNEGEYISPSLISDGFIHCSTIKQTTDTANIFFKGQKGLILLYINESKLEPECKYEDACGGALHNPEVGKLFPHIYGPINLSAVEKVLDFPPGDDGLFALPQGLE